MNFYDVNVLIDETPPPPINNFQLIRAKDKKLMLNTGVVYSILSSVYMCVCMYTCLVSICVWLIWVGQYSLETTC